MAKKRIWPWIVGLVAVGGGLAAAAGLYGNGGRSNLYYYLTLDEYNAAEQLPPGSNILVVAFNPDHPQAANVKASLERLAGLHPGIMFVAVSDEIGRTQLGMDLGSGWGGVAAGAAGDSEETFSSIWSPQTSKDQIDADIVSGIEVFAGASKLPGDAQDASFDERPVAM